MEFTSRYFLLMVLQIYFCNAAFSTESYEMTKDMYETYPLKENSKVEIENKYGDVFIEVWEKDSVAFEIEVVAYSEKEEHLEDLIDRVEVNFKNYSSYVIAKTLIGEDRNLLDKAAFKFNKSITGTQEVRVNYKVYLPAHIALFIENQFGDVFLDSYDGEFNLDLSHGDFRVNKLNNLESMKVRHGEVKADFIQGGRCDFSFVKGAQLGIVKDSFIKCSSSEIDIDEIDVLRLESRLDQIYIESVDDISGKTNMTKLHIKYLHQEAELDSRYGNVRVDEITPTITDIKMSGSNTDYSFDFSEKVGGKFQVEMSKSKYFQSDKNMVVINNEYAIDEKLNGYNGSINDETGMLNLRLVTKNGDVHLGR